MDRFLQEVTDEAHSGGPGWGGSSHLAPESIVPGGAGRVEEAKPDENGLLYFV